MALRRTGRLRRPGVHGDLADRCGAPRSNDVHQPEEPSPRGRQSNRMNSSSIPRVWVGYPALASKSRTPSRVISVGPTFTGTSPRPGLSSSPAYGWVGGANPGRQGSIHGVLAAIV